MRLRKKLPRAFLLLALMIFAAPAFGQGTAIEPCPAATPFKPGASSAASPQKTGTKAKLNAIDASVPDDAGVEKMLAPYSSKVRELSKVIGQLEGGLSKTGVGAGTLGNFVTDGIKAQAEAKLGKPVSLAFVNAGGLRKNVIAAGDLRASDIFELLPFENALVVLEMTGVQLAKLLEIVPRDAQTGARIHFKWNDRNRPEFISGKLVDEKGQEQEIDPQKVYTVITIDYLVRLGSGSYAILQEAKSNKPLNITLRDAILDYVKSETAAGRPVRGVVDNRFVQVGPGPKTTENPR
ncbi:MAG TPA: 5'-nucleotidase C-terminal domain-containing protein [Pyrinomonadaceae bacterium]|nr:5'-nucleotidase C-terminal domain-containing protein [Pyrinomonadaceae bacterium]